MRAVLKACLFKQAPAWQVFTAQACDQGPDAGRLRLRLQMPDGCAADAGAGVIW